MFLLYVYIRLKINLYHKTHKSNNLLIFYPSLSLNLCVRVYIFSYYD